MGASDSRSENVNNLLDEKNVTDYIVGVGDNAVFLESEKLKSNISELELQKKSIVEAYLNAMMDKLKAQTDIIIDELVSIRKEKGMTQQEVADLVGVKASNIARFEAKKSNPSLQFLSKYANAVDYELDIKLVKNNRTK